VFERFTEEARQVVVLAQDEARGLKHNYIGTEHILLGLLREQGGLAASVLVALGLDLDGSRKQVSRIVAASEDVTGGQIPFTPRAKRVLELALREALSLGQNYIGPEHILLGLVRENEGVAAQVLAEKGLEPEVIRDAVVHSLPEGGHGRPHPGVAEGRLRVQMPVVSSVQPRPVIDPAWIDGLTPLLNRLAAEIRRELQREPDVGDLLLALACARGTLAGRALSALGVDLDRLWGTIEQLRAQASDAQGELGQQIEQVTKEKELAIASQEFDRAAQLRDRERELREQARASAAVQTDEALDAIRRHLGIPRSGDDDPPQFAENG
jgi:ATP-dependent Clp protease ATP-binding subunit ClpA